MNDLSPTEANTRLGIRLFLIYTAFYASFVLVNAFAASWSDWVVVGGLNLAVLWGFALIVVAFVLAIVYGIFCQVDHREVSEAPAGNASIEPSDSEADA